MGATSAPLLSLPVPAASSGIYASIGTRRRRRSPHAESPAVSHGSSVHTARQRAPSADGGGAPALLLRHVQVGEGALDRLGCTRDGLAEGRVRMDGEPDVGGIAAVLHRERDLADQLAGVGAYDAAAQHAVAVGIEQELGEALVASERERAAVRHPRERTLAERGAVGASV